MGFSIKKAIGGSILGSALGPIGTIAGGYLAGKAGGKEQPGLPGVAFPTRPEFARASSQFGELPANFQVNANQQGLEALRNVAFQEGPSDFAQALIDQQEQRANQALANVGQQSAGALANTKSAIQATSGLSGAQADKLKNITDRQALFARQNVRSQSDAVQEAILGEDADLRQRVLNTLPSLEVQALAPQQFNIENLIKEKSLEDQFNLQLQEIDNKMVAAGLQSEAIKRSGSKGLIGDLGSFFGL